MLVHADCAQFQPWDTSNREEAVANLGTAHPHPPKMLDAHHIVYLSSIRCLTTAPDPAWYGSRGTTEHSVSDDQQTAAPQRPAQPCNHYASPCGSASSLVCSLQCDGGSAPVGDNETSRGRLRRRPLRQSARGYWLSQAVAVSASSFHYHAPRPPLFQRTNSEHRSCNGV